MPELLGTASFPSGELLLVDNQLEWTGAWPPLNENDYAYEGVIAAANAADFEIVGPQAAEVAGALNLSFLKGRYVFDVSEDGEPVVSALARASLDASLRPLPRMAHETRARVLLDDRPGGAEVPFDGAWAVAVRGMPAGPLRVLGERDGEAWKSVWVQCADGVVASSAECGHVLTKWEQLLFADVQALSGWNVHEAVDGLYDLLLMGLEEADEIAAHASVPPSRTGDSWRWSNLSFREARNLEEELEPSLATSWGSSVLLLAHNHHILLRRQIESSSTGSGTVEVGGAAVTSWDLAGNGAFPVYRDLAADGTLLRVRVEFGGQEIVPAERKYERLWFGEMAKWVVATGRVMHDGLPIGRLHRETPKDEQDSGWRVFAGDETPEYLDDRHNIWGMYLRELLLGDRALEQLVSEPVGTAFERTGSGFARVR